MRRGATIAVWFPGLEGGYKQLHDILRLWRLTAAAQSDPGFADRLAAVCEGVRTGSTET